MRKILIVLIVMFVSRLFSYSPGRTSLTFLKIPVGAKPSSMGGAYTAVSEDAFGIFYNPAGVGNPEYNNIVAMHLEYFESIRYENIAAVFPIKRRYTVGVGLGYLYILDIPKTVSAENIEGFETVGSFNTSDILLVVSGIIRMANDSFIGLNIKYIQESIDNNSASTFAFDLGYSSGVPLVKDLLFGISALNLGLPLKYIERNELLPITVRAGLNWKIFNTRLNSNGDEKDITVALDFEKPIDDMLKIHLGGELRLFNRFYIRGGYQFNLNRNDIDFISIGGGVKFKQVNIDYSFVPYKFLGGTHRFSAGISF